MNLFHFSKSPLMSTSIVSKFQQNHIKLQIASTKNIQISNNNHQIIHPVKYFVECPNHAF